MTITELLDAPAETIARDTNTGATYHKEADGWWRRPGALACVNSAWLSGFHISLEYPA